MSTIQFKIESEALAELLKLTNEKTGTKAIQHSIDGYKRLLGELERLQKEHYHLKEEHRVLKLKVSDFSNLLGYFKEFSASQKAW